ncbi:hypothetical protein Droror1_Dr00028057 [Drosera rotundifolia]
MFSPHERFTYDLDPRNDQRIQTKSCSSMIGVLKHGYILIQKEDWAYWVNGKAYRADVQAAGGPGRALSAGGWPVEAKRRLLPKQPQEILPRLAVVVLSSPTTKGAAA